MPNREGADLVEDASGRFLWFLEKRHLDGGSGINLNERLLQEEPSDFTKNQNMILRKEVSW